jgi:hypothetical protein
MEYIVPSMVRHPLGGTCLVKVAQLCGHEVRYPQATSIYEGRFPRRSRSGFTSV